MCAAAQIMLGADLLVVGLALIASISGLAAWRLGGVYTSAGWFALFFALGNSIVALIAKTAILQELDSNLYAPRESYLALVVGSAAVLVALLVARTLPVGQPIFRPISETRRLRALSNFSLTLGVLFWYLNRLVQEPGAAAFGGFAVFWNLMLMAVIARTAYLFEKSNGQRSFDLHLAIILVCCVLMGLLDNSKTKIALPVVAYFATSLFYRRGFTRKQIVSGVIGVILMASVIGPLVHIYRGLGIQDVPWRSRITLLARGIEDGLFGGRFDRYEKFAADQFTSSHYQYFGKGQGQMLLGRYASIQQIDPVIAEASRNGALGGDVVWPAFARLLPSFLVPGKPKYIEGYVIGVQLGLIYADGGKFPTVPLLAQSYAAFRGLGLMLIPFLAFLALLLALKKLGWHLERNVFAIFFLCVFTIVYANQGDLGQYVGAVLRTFPLLGLIFWLWTKTERINGFLLTRGTPGGAARR